MKLLTIIFQSLPPPPGQRDSKNSLATELLQEDSCLYKLHFFKLYIFQCSQRYFVLYFWNIKFFKYSILNSVFHVNNKTDILCKLLADKKDL